MGSKPPAFKRFFRSPTFITIARPLYAVPIAAAVCALLIIGGGHLLSQQSPANNSHYTAEQKIKNTAIPIAKAPTTSSGSSTTPDTGSTSNSDASNLTSSGSPHSSSSSNSNHSNQASIPAVANASCPAIVKSLTDTYQQEMSDAKTLLQHNLVTAVLDIVLQNKYIDNYNISITGIYNQVESAAQKDNCSLVLSMPHLLSHNQDN